MKKTILLGAALLMAGSVAAADVSGKLQSVTMFRTGAELTHAARAQLVSGTNEVTVVGLSSTADQNSISIRCSNGVTVMGFDLSKDYVTVKEQTASVKKMKDSVDIYTVEIEKLTSQQSTNENLSKILLANMTNLNTEKGAPTAENYAKLVDYYRTKSLEIGNEQITLRREIDQRKKRVVALNNQIAQEQGRTGQPIGKLALRLAAPLAGPCDIEVTYFTSFAFWTPLYDIRAYGSEKPLTLVSKAKLTQSTGIDWEKAKITLSTAVPSRGRTAPEINNPWFISPAATRAFPAMDEVVMVGYGTAKKADPTGSLAGVQVSPAPAPNMMIRGTGSMSEPLYVVDGQIVDKDPTPDITPSMIESINILKGDDATARYGSRAANGVVLITTKKNFVTESDTESAETTYALDLPFDLKGNGSEHTVTLRTIDVPATFQYLAIPRLDRNVFLLASIKDWSQYNLLAGEAIITNDGTYAGRTTIDPNSAKDELQLTLGEERRVAVTREKVQDFSSTKFLGSEKRVTYSYKFTIRNNKQIPVDMILKDQYPISTDKSIIVELNDIDGAHDNPEVGSLTWEFPLKAGETRTIRLTYTIRSPKDFVLR